MRPARIVRSFVPLAVAIAGFFAVSLFGAATASEQGPDDVSNMDLDFLQEKLLKIWIIEEAGDRHNQRRIAEKSFKGMTPLEPTGDAENDAINREEYLKNDKHLRHFMLLELDGAIEVIDICNHVLGRQLVGEDTDAALKELLDKELPAIKWRNKKLDWAMKDLGKKLGVPVDFDGIASNEDVRIDLELDAGFTFQNALEYIMSYHAMDYSLEGGRLKFSYLGSDE